MEVNFGDQVPADLRIISRNTKKFAPRNTKKFAYFGTNVVEVVEVKSSSVMESFKNLVPHTSLVRRNGEKMTVMAKEVCSC